MKTIKKKTEVLTASAKPRMVGIFLERPNDKLISLIRLSLTQAISYFRIILLKDIGEASQYLVKKEGELLITDSEIYLDLASKYAPKLFKIKLEKEFSYSHEQSDLESKPFIYESETNLLRIRKKSAGNIRFLYEVFNITFNPPLVDLTFSCEDKNNSIMDYISEKFITLAPFAKFKIKKSNVDPVSVLDIDVKVQRERKKILQINRPKTKILKSKRFDFQEELKEYIDHRINEFMVGLGSQLQESGYINFYPAVKKIEKIVGKQHRIR